MKPKMTCLLLLLTDELPDVAETSTETGKGAVRAENGHDLCHTRTGLTS